MRVAQHLAALRAEVSVLFNEPKLLKLLTGNLIKRECPGFSALQRAEIAEMPVDDETKRRIRVSVLFNEPKLLKSEMFH